MKIVVIGGTGLIGSKLVAKLRERGHETVAASPASGVNTLTVEGLAAAIEGPSVVTDVSNSPSFEDAAVLEFFEFINGIADAATSGNTVRLAHVLVQPMAAGACLAETRFDNWLNQSTTSNS